MNRKSIGSFLCAMMLAILLISCNDNDDYDGLAPAELSGTYSNKLSAPANGDSLILSYNGNTFIGKDVKFKTDDGKTADIILKYVLPQIDMIIRQVMINKQTKADSGDSAMGNAFLAAYQKINAWPTNMPTSLSGALRWKSTSSIRNGTTEARSLSGQPTNT